MLVKKQSIIFIFLIFLSTGCSYKSSTGNGDVSVPIIASSVAPFVHYLSGIVEPYFHILNVAKESPTAEDIDLTVEQIKNLSKSQLYFSFNLPFEQVLYSKHVLPNNQFVFLTDAVHQFKIAETTEQVDSHSITGQVLELEHKPTELDPHVWMSPKQMMLILNFAVVKIQALDPTHKDFYQEHLKEVQKHLQQLDHSLSSVAKGLSKKEFLVFHPAYGYLARDYGLTQIAIEKEGKETSIKEMADVIQLIKTKNIPVLFLQANYRDDLLKNLQQETGIHIIQVNPLDEDYDHQIELIMKGLAGSKGS